jgi:carbon-monoxide dehydrogenase medium subunit
MLDFKYFEPLSSQEVCSLLNEYPGSAAVLAGGTDLLNQLHKGKCKAQVVIQLKKVKELSNRVQADDEGITIGALATLSDVVDHAAVQQRFAAIAEGALQVGSKQIRNKATLVGNICNASPAADTVPALLLYDAVIQYVGADGIRNQVPLASFIKGPGSTILKQDEFIESVFVPYSRALSASTYIKLARREGVDLAIVGVAAYADVLGNVRIALGAVGPVAFRAHRAEKTLSNSNLQLTEEHIAAGAYEAVMQARPISDLRATREYRLAMVDALTRQAVKKAICSAEALKG